MIRLSSPNTVDSSAIAAAIRSYIVEALLLGHDGGLDDADSLYETGVLDSTAVMELVAFLESHYNIEVQDEELTESNLGSISNISAFVKRKTGGTY